MKTFDPSSHQAKKRFGQNFLHDAGVIDRIVSSIRVESGDNLVEIGPGLGAMTKQILPLSGEIEVIELDRDIIPKLKFNCDGLGKLTIHEIDALKIDYSMFAEKGPVRVVGNLPYNISTPILFKLFEHIGTIKDMHLMLQKEVVERMVAGPGSKTYGRLSIMTQAICEAKLLFIVPPTAFTPPPKVESAIVYLAPRKQALNIVNWSLFSDLVAEAFNQRRKTLRNVWKKRISGEDLTSLGIDAGLRPENLSLSEFVKVSNFLAG